MVGNCGAITLIKKEDTHAGASTFVRSELFARTFREGMSLVEESANYLDGAGRDASKALPRDAAVSYAGASMRLTTLLMQIASWLLVLRAVREGEMAIADASDPKYRLEQPEEQRSDYHADGLPDELLNLLEAAQQLYMRISRLDAGLFTDEDEDETQTDAAGQQRALMRAFGARS